MAHKETVKFMHCFSGKRELVLERQVPDMLEPSATLLCADRGQPQETLMHYEKGTQKQHGIICRRFGEGGMHAGIHPDFLLMGALVILIIWCVIFFFISSKSVSSDGARRGRQSIIPSHVSVLPHQDRSVHKAVSSRPAPPSRLSHISPE